jgi:uncharacterized membrane protein
MFSYKKILPIVLILLIILQIGLSAYLIYEANTSAYICVVGQSCDYVQNTQYGTMFGIKLAYLSIFAFVFLGIMFFVNRYLFLISAIVGSLFAIYFISIQLFVLKQICSTCMLLDGTMIIIAILAIINFVVNKNEKKQANKKSGKKKSKK